MRLTVHGAIPLSDAYKFWWLKYVTGFRPVFHCAKCLAGLYSKRVSLAMPLNEVVLLDEHESEVLYLCGVTAPFGSKHNFHLPFRRAARKRIHVMDPLGRFAIAIQNAEALPIPALEPWTHGKPKRFTSCKNFAFAASHFGWPTTTDDAPVVLDPKEA